MKKIDKIRNHLIKEINWNELMSKEHKKVVEFWIKLIPHLLQSVFASLAGIAIGITSSATGLKICAITAGIEMYKSTNKKNKKKHDKIMLLAKS